MLNLIPKPTSIDSQAGEYAFTASTTISAGPEVKALADYLSEQLGRATGRQPTVHENSQLNTGISLQLEASQSLGEEGYELTISPEGIRLQANRPAGLFYAIQSLLQLLSPGSVGDLHLPAVSIRDTPRFEWRGVMLDVARHFFGVQAVKRFIDLIAFYKINRLHLHLTDDQGWRIEIKSWPRLTEIGGRTQVGDRAGGYYTQEQYKEIVDYARSRYITIVPEIDTPGHTNAALASYAELNPTGQAPSLYEGTEVGFSTLWIENEITYRFLDDVIRELAALTPGPYIHIGGDEARSTPEDDYKKFIKRVQEIVIAHGKRSIGWSENIGTAEILPGTIAQHWFGTGYQEAKEQGARIILSPANRTYIDMKYDDSTPLGLDWAGLISVKDSYDWEPGSYMHLLEESDILGIEAPLWTETIETLKDIEYMVFPRLVGIAELAWSPKGRSWEEYRRRLTAHSRHMEALQINFYRAPDVDWESTTLANTL
ncbi:MAG: beta-N-acetylhexosaminidase [Bacteroidota bacterium]